MAYLMMKFAFLYGKDIVYVNVKASNGSIIMVYVR